MEIIDKENVPYTDDGLEAILFTAQGDMRQVAISVAFNHKLLQPVVKYWIYAGKQNQSII